MKTRVRAESASLGCSFARPAFQYLRAVGVLKSPQSPLDEAGHEKSTRRHEKEIRIVAANEHALLVIASSRTISQAAAREYLI